MEKLRSCARLFCRRIIRGVEALRSRDHADHAVLYTENYRMAIVAAIGYLVLSHLFSSLVWRGMQRILKIGHNFDNGIYALNIFVGSLFAYCWSRSILYVNLDSLTYTLQGFGVALLSGLLATVAMGTVCYLSEREHRH